MATVVSVCQYASRAPWSGEFTYPYAEKYNVDYLVQVDSAEVGPASIYTWAETEWQRLATATGLSDPPAALPILGQVYLTNRAQIGASAVPGGSVGEGSSYVQCMSIRITPNQPADPRKGEDPYRNLAGYWEWVYSCEFAAPGTQPMYGNSLASAVKNPLERPAVEWLEYEFFEDPLTHDITNRRIASTVGEPFVDPPVTRKRGQPLRVFRKNYATLSEIEALVDQYLWKTNSMTWKGCIIDMALMYPPRVQPPVTELGITYYPVEWIVATKSKVTEAWNPLKLVNAGYHYYDHFGTPWKRRDSTGEWRNIRIKPITLPVLDPETGKQIGVQPPTQKMRLTLMGEYWQYLANPMEADTILTFDVHERIDFNQLLP